MELAGRLEGVDPFGDDVVLDEWIMEGKINPGPFLETCDFWSANIRYLLALPAGCKVLSTSHSGKRLWVETMWIDVELPDGTKEVFFKKVWSKA